ncbi:MAG: aldehyde dehydrogenase family protein [Bosea sp. (in: a-proteobacteria)]|uniref:aldehyde dehydrogenase family protein n=1 Tax=Bosea sp. (in: a-proteobacteria) TaxID=1871050 RepID=UPI00273435E5|nr:aldehyde dehydrogenase family protein [Bosea sp. (in: a-proteobacteria)]MDP3599828.1 aldehyde dehydrogenase family protein [Bosea sp. (in: a-proteobacteria)]
MRFDRAELVEEARRSGTLAGLPSGHFIDGRFVASISGAKMESFDPGRGVPFATFAAGSAEDVARAVAAARAALSGPWSRLTPAARGEILMRASHLLRERAARFAVVETLDSGKLLAESEGDVGGVVRCLAYYAGAADKLQGDSVPLGPDYLGVTIEEPVGVVAQIVPWNYPLSTAARGIAPALAAGCTLVVKPAEQTPFTTLMLAELLHEAGLPAGVLNVVAGTGAEAGATLVAHPVIDHITFTGSVATGQSVMRAAAEHVTRLQLELGGKSPVVLMADCEIEAAVEGVIGAIYENAGQICSAGSRLIVEKAIAQEVLDRLVARVEAMALGHGLSEAQIGPINSPQQLARIDAHVARARAAGNRILTGGGIVPDAECGGGWFYRPTIILADGLDDPLVQEEIFGPVLTVQIVQGLDEAIAAANATPYALVAGIYTRDHGSAWRFARAVDAGQVYINEFFAGGVAMPFGGNRKSGFGRAKGMAGLRSYCKLKSVVARL